jgi:hypothetical protein
MMRGQQNIKFVSNHYLKPGPVKLSTFSAEYYVLYGMQWHDRFQSDMKILLLL